MQTFLGCDYVIGRALVSREIANQLQNDWNVRDGGVTNLKVSGHLKTILCKKAVASKLDIFHCARAA
jgi:hypothetical protein